jgi:hypothetical protein
MNGSTVRILPAFLLLICVLTIGAPVRAQLAAVSTRPAITVLDSTKEQDGLLGSVRRVKTETAKIELKDGRPVEGPPQLIEVTTYGIKGNRIENTSYPTGGSLAGKEEYKYDERGNITEMTVRDDRGAILSREAYNYEFDKFGNWTKMVTNLVVFENGELKREPVEVTYRTLTYYFDDSIAKIVEDPKARPTGVTATQPPTAPPIPAAGGELRDQAVLDPGLSSVTTSIAPGGDSPPPLLKRAEPEGVTSAYAARKGNESASENVTAPVVAPAETAPPSAQVQLSLGHEYLKAQNDREAIKAFKESIKLNPALAEPHYGLGYSSFRLGRFRDAADAFKKAIALEPKMAKAHYGLSLAYQELGMTSQLMEEYRILETLDRSLAKKLAQTFPQFNFSCRLVRGCP